MKHSLGPWLRISFLNLLIVAFLGSTLRYKIAFSLPFVDQKFLLHGHSHFAFAGWMSQALMTLMLHDLGIRKGEEVIGKFRWILYANLFSAYGMLISFPIQGYAFWSILFSTLSIFSSYAFAIFYWKEWNHLKQKSAAGLSYKASLIFNVFSSIGVFALAYMMASKRLHQRGYLASVYFFLHFQYNGWFFFACLGLLFSKLEQIALKNLNAIFWLFALACTPAYFLSALWMNVPLPVYILVIASAIAQLVGWVLLILFISRNREAIGAVFSGNARILLILSSVALSIKLLLQLGSTHPALSQLAFGFRPIVVGYLHLVLLGVITIFILGYVLSLNHFHTGKFFYRGIWIFISGIIVNEFLLMVQGISGMNYVMIPLVNESLLLAALIMFAGILLMILNLRVRR